MLNLIANQMIDNKIKEYIDQMWLLYQDIKPSSWSDYSQWENQMIDVKIKEYIDPNSESDDRC